ncbi:nucleotidyltransferase domain-containing protein [Maribellus mangrovi]|uniref:nucleotidyltransferase domain-containing protein n=1 Tax=Maribellus mangrovi TaxID=3133146 RepID=UPI0030EB65CC
MRLKNEIKTFIKDKAHDLSPDTEVYLFGSRTNDQGRGGDIDILLLTDQMINKTRLRRFRLDFYKKFGWQKIDLVNFTKNDTSAFKRLILTTAQPIV